MGIWVEESSLPLWSQPQDRLIRLGAAIGPLKSRTKAVLEDTRAEF